MFELAILHCIKCLRNFFLFGLYYETIFVGTIFMTQIYRSTFKIFELIHDLIKKN